MLRSTIAVAVGLVAVSAVATEPRLPFLLNLQGGMTQVRYTHGSLDRAANLQRRLDLLIGETARRLGVQSPLECLVMSREEWESMKWQWSYGLPLSVGPSRMAVPAWGDPDSLDLWEAALGRRLPPAPGMPMRGTPEEASALAVSDLLAQMVAAEALVEGSGLPVTEPWHVEAIADLMAVDGFMRYESLRLGEIDGLFRAFDASPGGAAVRGSELAWLKASAAGYDAARLALSERGSAPLKKLIKRVRKKGLAVTTSDLVAAYGTGLAEAYQRK